MHFLACNDNCTGLLLDDLSWFANKLISETSHITTGSIPPPWEQIFLIDSNVTLFLDAINQKNELRKRLEMVPWHDYKKLLKESENSLHNVSILFIHYLYPGKFNSIFIFIFII